MSEENNNNDNKRKVKYEYNLRKKAKFENSKKNQEDDDSDYEPSNEEMSENDSGSGSDSDSETNSLDSEDLTDIDDNIDDDPIRENNLDILNEDAVQRRLTKSVINTLITEISEIPYKKFNLNNYLNDLENKMNLTDLEKNNKYKNNIVERSALEITNSIIMSLIVDIRKENDNKNKKDTFNILEFLQSKLDIMNELDELYLDNNNNLMNFNNQVPNGQDVVLKLMINPFKFLTSKGINNYYDEDNAEEEEDDDSGDYEDENPKDKNSKKKDEYDKKFMSFLQDGVYTPKDDLKYFRELPQEEKKKYLETIEDLKNKHRIEKPKILKMIEADTSFNNKSVVLNKFQNFDTLTPFSSEYFKLKNWVDGIMNIPFGVLNKSPVERNSKKSDIKSYLKGVRKHMDNAVYGHEAAKKQILQVIAQTITNPSESGTIIAIQGPPGVGKTQLIQDGISKALGRPFEFISLGGATDSCFLEGHDYTYEGSRWGKIVDVLMRAKCMNPVIFFDELDKVSETAKGEEIINILTHLTDATQNHHFNDKYFTGIDFDMSKAIFIFSFNEEHKINRILKDRMYVIRTDGFELKDKIKIGRKYLIPKLIHSVGFQDGNIVFPDELIEFIIENYTFEGGVRRLKECLLEIIKEVNLRLLDGTKLNGKKITLPLTINSNMLTNDIFRKRRANTINEIHNESKIGLVNGLWANDMGVGGLIPIEAFSIPTTNKLELELTGQQGDVMQESMRCAKTVAWNVIPDNFKEKLNEYWKHFGNTGIHIHCPDGATPKDGPSAGAAITTAIISLLMEQKVNNEIAMTGEINLKGEVSEIGGLKEKLNGAKKAGAKHVLIPRDNMKDLQKIISSENSPLDNTFKVTPVDNIWDVLRYCFNKKVEVKKY
jgi:endopeptidase La